MRKQPPPERLRIDLAGVETQFDAWLGRKTDFADAAREYAHNRLQVKALDAAERQAVIAAACERAWARHAYVGVRRRKIERVKRADRTQQRLTSTAVKNVSTDWWEASRKRQMRLGLSGESVTANVLPIRDRTIDELITCIERDSSALQVARERERTSRALVVAVFTDVSDATIWSGESLRTTDGWTIGYTVHDVFNPGLAAQVAPQFDIDAREYLSDVPISGHVRWRVTDANSDDDHDGQFGVE